MLLNDDQYFQVNQEIIQNGMKRWSSLDKLSVQRRSVAILS